MALDVYNSALSQYQAAANKYRGRIEAGVGQAKTVVEVAGGAYGAARLASHLGGPTGKKYAGIAVELWIGGACAGLAMSGHAGKHADDLLAVGIGAVSAFTARKGFEAGLSSYRPPAEVPAGGSVQGVGCVALPSGVSGALGPGVGAAENDGVGAASYDQAASVLATLGGR